MPNAAYRKKRLAGYAYSPRETIAEKKKKAYRRITIISIAVIAMITVGLVYLDDGIDYISNIWQTFDKQEELTEATPITETQENLLWTPTIDTIPTITNQKKLSITGNAYQGVQVELFFNNESISIDDLDENKKFEFTDLNLQSGENTISVRAIKENGEKSELSKESRITLDLVPPSLEITNPINETTFGSGKQKVSVEGTTEEEVKLYVDDHIVIVKPDLTFSYQITLKEGENTITIKATDKAGNETKEERIVTFDPALDDQES